MANYLKMVDVVSILTLHACGCSCRRIARELGVDRDAVSRHVKLSVAGAGTPIRGAQPPGIPKPASEALTGILGGNACVLTAGASGGEAALKPRSRCAPWRQFIVDQLAAGHRAQRIYEDLVSDHGYVDSYQGVRRLARKLNQRNLRGRRNLTGRGRNLRDRELMALST